MNSKLFFPYIFILPVLLSCGHKTAPKSPQGELLPDITQSYFKRTELQVDKTKKKKKK